ncbi:MAG: MerR family transcriptional regulator [Planctomycetota bacterium]
MATAYHHNRESRDITLPELVEAVPGLLASGYDGARSGRVRDLPDARTVRWYQTLGMVDRPAAFRGRTALYGRRHLLQLAAIKKLQSANLPLADIQRGLAGKTDSELARSGGVTLKAADAIIERAVLVRSQAAVADLAAVVAGRESPPSRRATAFWKAKPIANPPAVPVSASAAMQSAALGDAAMLLWSGRELTAAERAELERIAGPLVRFLASVHPRSSAAPASAEGAPRAASSPVRPDRGARP